MSANAFPIYHKEREAVIQEYIFRTCGAQTGPLPALKQKSQPDFGLALFESDSLYLSALFKALLQAQANCSRPAELSPCSGL